MWGVDAGAFGGGGGEIFARAVSFGRERRRVGSSLQRRWENTSSTTWSHAWSLGTGRRHPFTRRRESRLRDEAHVHGRKSTRWP
jgi:hypothetical protein